MINPDVEIKMKRAAEVPTSSIHSDTETASNDLSILRKPIKTSVNGLNEAKKAYEDGTDEVSELCYGMHNKTNKLIGCNKI